MAVLVFPVFDGRAMADTARGAFVLRALPPFKSIAAACAVGLLDPARRVVAVTDVPSFVRVGAVCRVALRVDLVTGLRAGAAVVPRVAATLPAPSRVVTVRFAAVRAAAVRAIVVRLVVTVALGRVVFRAGVLVAAALVVIFLAGLADVVGAVRIGLARTAGTLAARIVLEAALGTAVFFVAGAFTAERDPAIPGRVVRVAPPRGLLPAARRPPARMAIARQRRPSLLLSLLMLETFFSSTTMTKAG